MEPKSRQTRTNTSKCRQTRTNAKSSNYTPFCAPLFAAAQRVQARKKEHKLKLLGPDIFRWSGGFPHEGVGAKSSASPSKFRKTNFSVGYPEILVGTSRGVPENFERKTSLCSIFKIVRQLHIPLETALDLLCRGPLATPSSSHLIGSSNPGLPMFPSPNGATKTRKGEWRMSGSVITCCFRVNELHRP